MFLSEVPADSVLALPVQTQPAALEGTRKKGPTSKQAQAMSCFDGITFHFIEVDKNGYKYAYYGKL